MHDDITTNIQVFSVPMCPFFEISMYSMPVLSREPSDGSHMKGAKHGCVSLPEIAVIALRGRRNAGNGGGGMDSIISGGGSKSKHSLLHVILKRKKKYFF